MNEVEKRFYEEIDRSISVFVQREIENIGDIFSEEQKDVIKDALRNAIIGTLHSTFVVIDGGTALSDGGKALELIDLKTGKSLTDGALHENFISAIS